MPTTLHENRPSARIGAVEVQNPLFSRDPLRGSAWSRCKNPWFFGPRDPLRGSAWSRCKNSRFSATSAVLAQPSAGIGVVEMQKLEVFCDFFVVRTGRCANRSLESLARTGRQTLTTTRPHSHRGAWSTSCRAQSLLLSPSGGLPARPSPFGE